MRRNHWTCSKFADWLRGTPKLRYGTAEEWAGWHKLAKNAHSFRYWLAEEALDKAQDFVLWPIDKIYDFKYYINNRFVTKTHQLTAHPSDIRPGEWSDYGNRILPCLFNEFVNFVEVELAWANIMWQNKKYRKKFNVPFWAVGWWRVRAWRSKESGLAYLDWASNLIFTSDEVNDSDPRYATPTPQAVAAKEVLDLYEWWTLTRPSRPEPMEVSGWSAICDRRRENSDESDKWWSLMLNDDSDREESTAAIKLMDEIEKQYEEEDTEMLIRLIKVRQHLWT